VKSEQFLAIPSLCKNTNLLLVLLVGQVLISGVWLLLPYGQNMASYGLYSLYIQSVLLFSSAGLCFVRQFLVSMSLVLGIVFTTFLVVVVALTVEMISQGLNSSWQFNVLDLERFVEVGLAASIIFLLITRYFVLLSVLDIRSKAEAEARILSLQAKIQPHFLFNSLNTISELTQESPRDAEKAIHALSILFRASLENSDSQHSVSKEISLCERYLELELWRFDDNLNIKWNVILDSPDRWLMPKLLLQPLVENALKYGRLDDGCIDISIDVRETKSELSFLIENSISENHQANHGNGIAMNNIKERLMVMYDDHHVVKIRKSKETYSVLVRIPKFSKPRHA
jgi:two-component system sensor histidine kinase AlgZ